VQRAAVAAPSLDVDSASIRRVGAAPPTGSGAAGAPPGLLAARCEAATKVYGRGETQVRALDSLTVGFARGEFAAIMGPSGSGKSTLMHCMAGLDRLTSGRTFIADVELGGLSERRLTELRRDRIGFVFQAFNLVPTLDARENITLPLDLARRRPDPAWLDAVVRAVGLGDRLRHRPNELSGGQQQRVAVARALVGRPEIIFADEPTGNLDSRASAEILAFMRRATEQLGQTIVMVTHDPTAAAHAERVVFVADGRGCDEVTHPTVPVLLERMKRLGRAERPAEATRPDQAKRPETMPC
jgi:putative ABC transport system ATP-binding protein